MKMTLFNRRQTLKAFIICLTLFLGGNLYAQNGTYEKKNSNGSYCYISLEKTGNHVTAEIFAWWNTPSSQTGSYYGKGTLTNNSCTLQSVENEPDCKVKISLNGNKVTATYESCATDHLTEDFNGSYTKITDATAGDYVVAVAKSYFHREPDADSKLGSYIVKGDRVTLNMDRIVAGNWIFVYYTNPKGNESEGYINLSDLKKVK